MPPIPSHPPRTEIEHTQPEPLIGVPPPLMIPLPQLPTKPVK